MANRPAKAGSDRGLAPMGDVAPSPGAAPRRQESPPPVHHDASPHAAPPRASVPRAAGHRAARSRAPGPSWVPYLIVLAGAAAGMFLVWRGSRYAGLGAGLLGAALLVAALARLALPARYAGLLSTRRKASDVLFFATFGVAVLAVALLLP